MKFNIESESRTASVFKSMRELQVGDKLKPWALVALTNFVQAATHGSPDESVLFAATDGDLFYAFLDDNLYHGVQVMTDGEVINRWCSHKFGDILGKIVDVVEVDLEPCEFDPKRAELYGA